MEKFYLDKYVRNENTVFLSSNYSFSSVCQLIKNEFQEEWKSQEENTEKLVELQKKAIIGYNVEVKYFKKKIGEILRLFNINRIEFPQWYENLEEAIYHENWGLAGIAEWFSPQHEQSSSAKIIGDQIYFLENGRMKLKPQKISKNRREQLTRAFLLLTPEEKINKDFHELYMIDGTRITIFSGHMVKENQDVIIFRRYVIPQYTFEEQARRGTIPQKAIPLFEKMVQLGYNCAFTGAPRSSKTTFLTTWQSYEERELEGVMVETDPEIPLHKLMPKAPIMQILADNEALKSITKNLLRSDADYFIMAEARDGVALDTALRLASKGIRRMKITFHSKNPLNFPYDVADEIVRTYGGDVFYNAKRAAGSFDYIFHFIQLRNKSQKRLRSIYEISYSNENSKIDMNLICNYDVNKEDWRFYEYIGKEKEELGKVENLQVFKEFKDVLCDLANPV